MPFIPDGQQQNTNDLMPQLAGALGGTVGQGLGSLADPFIGPAGTIGGGAIGGALSQGGAQAIQNLMQGQPINQNVIPEAGQGAAWGAVPGTDELKAGAEIGDIVKLLLKRGAIGGGAGAVTQGIQNVQQGKPIAQNVPQSAALAGGINAIAPGVAKVLGKPLQAFTGTSQGVLDQVAKFFVGDKLARDPEIVQHLDLQGGDWLKSQQNITKAMDQVYKPIVDTVSQKSAKLSDFLDAVKNGMIQEKDMTSAKINQNVRNITDFIRRNMNIPTGSVGAQNINNLSVPGNILNEAKKLVGKWYQDGQFNPAYTEAKNFIEKMAPEVDVAGINKKYAKLADAATMLDKNFAGSRTTQEMNKGMGWMQRAAMSIGAGITGGALGLPTGSIYGSAGGGVTTAAAAYVLTALKDAMTKTPQRAVKYAQGLEKVGPSLETALQQLLLRGSPYSRINQ